MSQKVSVLDIKVGDKILVDFGYAPHSYKKFATVHRIYKDAYPLFDKLKINFVVDSGDERMTCGFYLGDLVEKL